MPVLYGTPREAKGLGKCSSIPVRQLFHYIAHHLTNTFSFRLNIHHRKPRNDSPQGVSDPLLPGELMRVSSHYLHIIFSPDDQRTGTKCTISWLGAPGQVRE